MRSCCRHSWQRIHYSSSQDTLTLVFVGRSDSMSTKASAVAVATVTPSAGTAGYVNASPRATSACRPCGGTCAVGLDEERLADRKTPPPCSERPQVVGLPQED